MLGHLNKNTGSDGKKNYEGTGDLRADSDELIYLDAIKHSNGSLTVSTRIDKSRGNIKDVTFEIGADRAVSVSSSYIDVMSVIEKQQQREANNPVIQFIQNSMPEEGINLTQLFALSQKAGAGFSRSMLGTVLNRHINGGEGETLWTCSKGLKHSLVYKPLKLTPALQTEN